jgi:hypothetical protein
MERNEETLENNIDLCINDFNSSNENDILDQVLRKNENLLQELDQIRQENKELKKKLNIELQNKVKN